MSTNRWCIDSVSRWALPDERFDSDSIITRVASKSDCPSAEHCPQLHSYSWFRHSRPCFLCSIFYYCFTYDMLLCLFRGLQNETGSRSSFNRWFRDLTLGISVSLGRIARLGFIWHWNPVILFSCITYSLLVMDLCPSDFTYILVGLDTR